MKARRNSRQLAKLAYAKAKLLLRPIIRNALFLWCHLGFLLRRNLPLHPESDVVVSVASFPTRVKNLPAVIYSATRAKPFVREVIVVLAEEDFLTKETPKSLERFETLGGSILWTSGIPGAVKKLLPVQDARPDCRVVAIDDDVLYRRSAIQLLIEASSKDPRAIVGNRALNMKRSGASLGLQFRQGWANAATPRIQVYFHGWSGVLYPPNCFPKTAYDRNQISQTVPGRGSDFWFWAAAVAAGTPQHNLDSKGKTDIPGWRSAASRETPGKAELDRRFQATIDHYGIREVLLRKLPDAIPCQKE